MAFVRLYTIDEVACLFREYQHEMEGLLEFIGIDFEISKIKSVPNTVTVGEVFVVYLSRDILKEHPQPIALVIVDVLLELYANIRTIGYIPTGKKSVHMPVYEYNYKLGDIGPDEYLMLREKHYAKPWEDVPMWTYPLKVSSCLKSFYEWLVRGLKIHRALVRLLGVNVMDCNKWRDHLSDGGQQPGGTGICYKLSHAYDYAEGIIDKKHLKYFPFTVANEGGLLSKPVLIEEEVSKFQLK